MNKLREKARAATTKWRAKNPERHAEQTRRQTLKRFGITIEEYDRMATSQGCLCAICRKPEPVEGRQLAVDHDHITGRIRALLCSVCNTSLGKWNDDPVLIRRAAEYVESFRG